MIIFNQVPRDMRNKEKVVVDGGNVGARCLKTRACVNVGIVQKLVTRNEWVHERSEVTVQHLPWLFIAFLLF